MYSDLWSTANNTVDRNVWNRFLHSIRYFGGAVSSVNPDGTPSGELVYFMTHIPNPPDRVYTVDNDPAAVPNQNAVFASFVGVNTLYNIGSIAENNLLFGVRDIRAFISEHFPNMAYVMRHVGEIDFYEPMGVEAFVGTGIDGDAAVRFDLGENISEILIRPFTELDTLSELGVNNDLERKAALLEEIRKIRNPDGSEFAGIH
jgi:hypothetical protein